MESVGKTNMKTKLVNDRFRRNRGGYSRLLTITCEKCGSNVCKYQKDGPGNLRRMYIDRISDSAVSTSGENFICPNKHLLGIRTIYKKENRPAFRLFVDSVAKRIVKG